MIRHGAFRMALLAWCALFFNASTAAAVQPAETAPIRSSLELFDLFGMDQDFFQRFENGQVWGKADQQPLMQLLARLPEVKLSHIHTWVMRDVNESDIAAHPQKYERRFLALEGRMRRVSRVMASPEQQDRYAITDYFRCEMTLASRGAVAVVFARHVPSGWQLETPVNYRASVAAVFLKTGPADAAAHAELFFAADRIAWHPETVLGKAGMDYGLFDTVQQNRPITAQDRECFYQLLAAAGRAIAPQQPAANSDPVAQLGPLTKTPQRYAGEPYSFRGVARRAIRIQVNDPDVVSRLGFDHYFDVVVFVELNGYLNVAGEKVRSFPVVFCLRELPAGMPTGENIGEMVQATGFMFKQWRYNTQLAELKQPGLRMSSPLLIGKTATWERRETAQRLIDPYLAGALLAATVLIGVAAWWFNRRDRQRHTAVVRKSYALAEGQSLNDLKFDLQNADGESNPD